MNQGREKELTVAVVEESLTVKGAADGDGLGGELCAGGGGDHCRYRLGRGEGAGAEESEESGLHREGGG